MTRRYLRDDVIGREYLAYVSPGSVRYDTEDIVFLFPWLKAMREGIGPADPQSSRGVSHGSKDYAHYEAWCKVAAEIDRRLERCHEDRLIAERYLDYLDGLARPESPVEYDEVMARIGREIHRDVRKVHRALQSVLSYIASGPCPRWLACVDCDACHTCRKLAEMERTGKKRDVCTYEEWKGHRRNKPTGGEPK